MCVMRSELMETQINSSNTNYWRESVQREMSVQGAGGETRGEETAGETQAYMGG